jgi:hypothetical protein
MRRASAASPHVDARPAIHFAGSFAMSRYSIWLEVRLQGGAAR